MRPEVLCWFIAASVFFFCVAQYSVCAREEQRDSYLNGPFGLSTLIFVLLTAWFMAAIQIFDATWLTILFIRRDHLAGVILSLSILKSLIIF